jgi:hypothetical protein
MPVGGKAEDFRNWATDPSDPSGQRFSKEATAEFDKLGIRGSARYNIGRMMEMGGDPRQFIDEKGFFNEAAMRRELRATSPSFVAEEFGEWMQSDAFKQAELDLRRNINAMREGGGPSFRGRVRGTDAAAQYNKFMETQLDAFGKARKQQDDMYIDEMVEQGKMTRHQGDMEKAANKIEADQSLEKAKHGYRMTEIAKRAELQEESASEKFERDKELQALGFKGQEQLMLARYAEMNNLDVKKFGRSMEQTREKAANDLKIAKLEAGINAKEAYGRMAAAKEKSRAAYMKSMEGEFGDLTEDQKATLNQSFDVNYNTTIAAQVMQGGMADGHLNLPGPTGMRRTPVAYGRDGQGKEVVINLYTGGVVGEPQQQQQ